MEWFNAFLKKIPAWMSSKVSILIFLFLFCYLVLFALIGYLVPSLAGIAPDGEMQLLLGNYSNVLSALGASIAAGTGAAVHSRLKKLHESHQELRDEHKQLHESMDELHRKIDRLSSGAKYR